MNLHFMRIHVTLAVSSQAPVVTITSTHYTYPLKDGQAELAWLLRVKCQNDIGLPKNGHPSQY